MMLKMMIVTLRLKVVCPNATELGADLFQVDIHIYIVENQMKHEMEPMICVPTSGMNLWSPAGPGQRARYEASLKVCKTIWVSSISTRGLHHQVLDRVGPLFVW